MNVPGYRDHPVEAWDPVAPADPGEAEDFLRQCYLENPRLGPVETAAGHRPARRSRRPAPTCTRSTS